MSNQEEVANTVTHAIGFVLSLIGFGVLLNISISQQNFWLEVSTIIYGSSLLVVYGASTLYHWVTSKKTKSFLQRVDHAAIYFFIAGTYTPFTLVLLREDAWWGWSLFTAIWLLAFVGMTIKLGFMGKFKKLSLISYICMGWLAIIAIKPLYDALSIDGIYWLMAGGISYSLGVIFYKWEKLRFNHAIWHVFVMGGSLCHFFCVLFYIYTGSNLSY